MTSVDIRAKEFLIPAVQMVMRIFEKIWLRTTACGNIEKETYEMNIMFAGGKISERDIGRSEIKKKLPRI